MYLPTVQLVSFLCNVYTDLTTAAPTAMVYITANHTSVILHGCKLHKFWLVHIYSHHYRCSPKCANLTHIQHNVNPNGVNNWEAL